MKSSTLSCQLLPSLAQLVSTYYLTIITTNIYVTKMNREQGKVSQLEESMEKLNPWDLFSWYQVMVV
jgi:hypothetical protein